MANVRKRGLGRGLDALLGDAQASTSASVEATPDGSNTTGAATGAGPSEATAADHALLELDPRDLRPNPSQPRTTFREEALEELAESIRRDGVQEPVLVRKRSGRYELVSGERRVRAAIMADLPTVPAICRDVSDADMLKLGLIENIQREDLNAIELALAYQRLIDEFGWTQEELAEQIGKNRVTVTNTLRLLNLPKDVQAAVADERITMGHARAILAIPTARAQSLACRKVIEQGLSVRQTEKLATPKPTGAGAQERTTPKDPNVAGLEDALRRSLGARVRVKAKARDKGTIEIEYYSLDDLERILSILQSKR